MNVFYNEGIVRKNLFLVLFPEAPPAHFYNTKNKSFFQLLHHQDCETLAEYLNQLYCRIVGHIFMRIFL